MSIEIAPGLEVETVGDILGESAAPVAKRIEPPRLEGAPPFPQPGIYFGMPESVYHSIHACSASGLKKLSISSMDYWANSSLNPDKGDDEDNKFLKMGRAYHCHICEGPEEFSNRYAVALDKADYHDDELVVTVKDIRAAIESYEVKPKGTAKGPLMDQLEEIDENGAFKIWDREVERHEKLNEGKEMISATLNHRIEIAARMIDSDPQLKDAFEGGHPEVALFWYDETTGAPMKCRLDYLKMNAWVDLKSFSNPQGKPIQRAIDAAISNQKYYIPVCIYDQGIEAVKQLVRDNGHRVIFTPNANREDEERADTVTWVWQWAHQPQGDVLFVFQQTGKAPVTRGRIMTRGTTYTVTEAAMQFLKRKWVRCAETYGTDPWLDIEPISATVDESINQWAATDFGDVA